MHCFKRGKMAESEGFEPTPHTPVTPSDVINQRVTEPKTVTKAHSGHKYHTKRHTFRTPAAVEVG